MIERACAFERRWPHTSVNEGIMKSILTACTARSRIVSAQGSALPSGEGGTQIMMPALCGIEVDMAAPEQWQPGGRLGLGALLQVTFEWARERERLESGSARLINSGVVRDVYEINGKVCKFTTLVHARATNIPEMTSARSLRGLVPACHGHFEVTVKGGKRVSVLVTARVKETVAELFDRLKEKPLSIEGGSAAVLTITRVIAKMVWAAGEEMELNLSDWHSQNIGIHHDDEVLLIDWEGTSRAPTSTPYRRIKDAMKTFLKWLPGFITLTSRFTPLSPLRQSVAGLPGGMPEPPL